ncbi:hypothetical protein EVAR_89758_1 [Eumeta japonica]|uniref:Uncharacterized protein n=1 Tax=Eumeta variegata TaxID=151549 RepID=A0A4C1XDN8_EUMVA|nr:hypothetical protein EVAR_89758_1 [Eumeta japonica]
MGVVLKKKIFVTSSEDPRGDTSCVRPLSLFYSDASADGVEERSLSFARSAQAERDIELCFFVHEAGRSSIYKTLSRQKLISKTEN